MKCKEANVECVFADGESCKADYLPCGRQKRYSSPEKAAVAYKDFLSSHRGEIRGLVEDDFYKMGGNGVLLAIREVEKRYKEQHSSENMPEGEFESIQEEILG